MTATSEQRHPEHTGSSGTRVLGAVTLAGVVAFLLCALVISPPEVDQGEAVRLLYIHVPVGRAHLRGVLHHGLRQRHVALEADDRLGPAGTAPRPRSV